MLGNGLAWRMGAQYLVKNLKQTLLSALAGAIGAMLITMSLFHYVSVKESGVRWVDSRFGPIDYVLVPVGGDKFNRADTNKATEAEMDEPLNRYLPAVSQVVVLYASGKPDGDSKSVQQVQALGVDAEQAASFDPGMKSLWSRGIGDGQALMESETAAKLGLKEGDAVWASDWQGERKPFIIRQIVKAAGLTGYRGEKGSLNGTILLNREEAARSLRND